MTHRAEQIVDAIASAISSSSFTGSVYKHRALSLSESDGELPAVSVDFGEDEPADDDGAANLSYVDSLLTVETTIYLREDEEERVKVALNAARTAIHIAVMASPRDFGFEWVTGIAYGGADKPEFDAGAEFIAGTLVCRWQVRYRMNITDPS